MGIARRIHYVVLLNPKDRASRFIHEGITVVNLTKSVVVLKLQPRKAQLSKEEELDAPYWPSDTVVNYRI